jgi:hypothetical protein
VALGGDREGERKRIAADVSKTYEMAIKTEVLIWLQDQSDGSPLTGQAVPGMEATRARSAAFTRNVGRQALTLQPAQVAGGERERVQAAGTVRR